MSGHMTITERNCMTDKILIAIANNIKQYRAKKKMTQKELAKKSKLSRSYISRVENAKANIYLDTLFQISKGLKIKLSKLVEEKGEKK